MSSNKQCQFSVALSLLENAIVEYYVENLGLDFDKKIGRVKMLRAIMRKYVQIDDNWDTTEFQKWAAKVAIPQEKDDEKRVELKAQVKSVDGILGLNARR